MKFPAFRVAAILLGIVSGVMLARDGFHIAFSEWATMFFRAIDNFFGGILAPIEDYAIHPFLDLLRRSGIHLELQPHWKYAFLLLWVCMGAWARATAANGGAKSEIAFYWIWGGLWAFIGGVITGTMPINSVDAFISMIWAGGAYAGGLAISNAFNRREGSGWAEGLAGVLILCLGVGLLLALVIDPSPPKLLTSTEGGARADNLAAGIFVVGLMGLVFLLQGAFTHDGGGDHWWQKWLGSTRSRVGLDILFILSGATAVTALARYTGLVGS